MVNHTRVVTRVPPASLGLTVSVLATLSILAVTPTSVSAQTKICTRTSTGMVPLMDMGTAKYKTYPGGLYTSGNTPPAAHLAAGMLASGAVTPLDASGKASTSGKIVVVSIGMSNTTQEFSEFVRISDADKARKPAVAVVDLAQGGMDATKVADPNHAFWTTAISRLTAKGLTANQVQVAWIKEAIAGQNKVFPANATQLRDLLGQIARNLQAKFPNIKICYVSSRIYAGYAGTALNPEPFAYEGGFATKWLIEQQISGDKTLNHDAKKGTVVAPWLAWGPYLWADGTKGRSDGLIWECADYANDGTHPATSGRVKVAVMLNNHFTKDVTAKPWYGGTPGGGGGTLARITPYGTACPGSAGPMTLRWNSMPTLGNTDFRFGLANGRPGSLALFLFSLDKADLTIQGCGLYVDVAKIFLTSQMSTNTAGATFLKFGIPNDTNLIGIKTHAQWINQDSQSKNLQLIGGGSSSQGGEILLGR